MNPPAPRAAQPPRAAAWLVGYRLARDRREFALGDLQEEFADIAVSRGTRAAKVWYWKQAGRILLSSQPRVFADQGSSRKATNVSALTQDIRFACRMLRRQPAFALAAALTLALGIGANTAIFGVTWQVLLKPLPYPQGDRLVEVWEWFVKQGVPNVMMPAGYDDIVHQAQSFDHVAAYGYFRGSVNVTGAGEPVGVKSRNVTGEYFQVFGMAPLLGRTLTSDDIAKDANVVVLSERLWRQSFAGARDVIGRSIRLNGSPSEIVGVMPRAFNVGTGDVDLWLPFIINPQLLSARVSAHFLGVVARLKPGVELTQANDDVKRIADRAAETYPSSKGLSARANSLHQALGGGQQQSLRILSGAAALVLLIACANLASLLLARGAGRTREFGVRAALGASRAVLVRQLLIESLVLSTAGGVLGVALASWTFATVRSIAPATVAPSLEWVFDPQVLGFAVAATVLSALLFASVPAWRDARHAMTSLRGRGESGDRAASIWRTALVTVEVGLTAVLIVGASLLLFSLANVHRVDPGFATDHVLTFSLHPPWSRYDTAARRDQLFRRLSEGLQAIPGVAYMCATNNIPLINEGGMTYVPEGRTDLIGALPRTVSPDCFAALGIPIRAGRAFSAREDAPVAVVSEGYARQAWPGENPIGKRMHIGVPSGSILTVIGVAADTQQISLESARMFPQVYQPVADEDAFYPDKVLIKTRIDPHAIVGNVRAVVHDLDRDLPVADVRTLDEVILGSLAARRFNIWLLGGFAAIALTLAMIGTYGLLAQLVAQRTQELSIRMALGATPNSVVGLVMRTAWLSIVAGLTIGLTGAYQLAHLLDRFVFHISTRNPLVYAGTAAALALAGTLAAWIPARRAARVDPVAALRQ